MIKLYNAFILPHLEYCSPLFVRIGTGQRSCLEDGNCDILRTLYRAQQVNVVRQAAHYG